MVHILIYNMVTSLASILPTNIHMANLICTECAQISSKIWNYGCAWFSPHKCKLFDLISFLTHLLYLNLCAHMQSEKKFWTEILFESESRHTQSHRKQSRLLFVVRVRNLVDTFDFRIHLRQPQYKNWFCCCWIRSSFHLDHHQIICAYFVRQLDWG